ncbi:MAG: Citrate synthase [Anaerolineales bacterium]|nr:Citrate synthase [Anaerolineales bacterium]
MPAEKSEELARGLAGVTVADTEMSFIDGEAGVLRYRGIPIEDLAENASYEEVVYLLRQGELPTATQLDEFKANLVKCCRTVPDEVIDAVRHFPSGAHPMAILRTAVSLLGLHDPGAEVETRTANEAKATQLMAGIPTLIALYERVRNGQEPVPPSQELGHAANFLYMLTGEDPNEVAVRAINTYLVLLADHGFNASTFTARTIASTESDMYSAITGAIGTLKGPLHGGANERVMKSLFEIESPDKAKAWVDQTLDKGQRIMGFGHRVYKTLDPRARILRQYAEALAEEPDVGKWVDVAIVVADAAEERLSAKGIWPNVDFYSAPVLYSAGIPVDQFTPIFVMSRVAGWTAHVLEQQADNRLIRPRAKYVGPREQPYVPMGERA